MAKKSLIVKAKVTKVKRARKSKGAKLPWAVGSVRVDGHHEWRESFGTLKEARACIKRNPDMVAPVIVHIDIKPMEY